MRNAGCKNSINCRRVFMRSARSPKYFKDPGARPLSRPWITRVLGCSRTAVADIQEEKDATKGFLAVLRARLKALC